MDKRELAKKLLLPFTWINRIIPKRRNRILIYANLGFRDNAKALYDYLLANGYGEGYEIICSTDEYREYAGVRAGAGVRHVSPKRGFLLFFTSRYVFYTFGKYPVKPAKSQVVVHMWHGMPLKRIGNMCHGMEKVEYNYFTYMVATSPFFGEVMQKCFRCTPDQILYTAQPKCDCLVRGGEEPEKWILWMPTYRKSSRMNETDAEGDGRGYSFAGILKGGEEWRALDDCLAELGFRMMIKLHPLEDVLPEYASYTNISVTNEQECRRRGIRMYDSYRRAAALISDYSSAYMDFLLLDRPVAFILADMEEYGRRRGFVVPDPRALMPGPELKSLSDIERFIRDVAEGRDVYKEERRKMNHYLNECQIGRDTGDLLTKIGLTIPGAAG